MMAIMMTKTILEWILLAHFYQIANHEHEDELKSPEWCLAGIIHWWIICLECCLIPHSLPPHAAVETLHCCWKIALWLKLCTAFETLHCCWNIALWLKLCTASKAQFTLQPALALCVHPSKIFSWCSRGWRWFRIQRHHRTVRLPHHKTHAQTHSIQPFASPSVPLMRSPRLRWCGAGCIISVNSLHLTKEPQLILSTLEGFWVSLKETSSIILESLKWIIDDQVDSCH